MYSSIIENYYFHETYRWNVRLDSTVFQIFVKILQQQRNYCFSSTFDIWPFSWNSSAKNFLRPFRPKLLVLFQTPLFNQLGSINDQRGLLVRLVFRLSSLRKLNFILLIFVIRQRNFNTNSMIILLEGMLNSNRWNYASQVIRYCRILQAKNIFRLKI